MKIAVLVKEVPDAAVTKRIDPATGRDLDMPLTPERLWRALRDADTSKSA